MTDKLRQAAEMALESIQDIIHWYSARDENDEVLPPYNQCPEVLEAIQAVEALRQAIDQLPDTTKMIEPSEQDKVDRDVLMYGQGFMKDGKHVPLHNVIIDRGAWSDVPDATKWVDELRGDEDLEEPPNSTTDVVEREWQGLTDEEILSDGDSVVWSEEGIRYFARAIEAKLKEKNT